MRKEGETWWEWFCRLAGPPLERRNGPGWGQPEEWGDGRMT